MEGPLVRKEAKGHGTGQYVEGPAGPGARVIVIDDVVTTGGSALQAVDRIIDYGAQVVQVVGIVDRLEGGAEAFAQRDLPFQSLLTIQDFGISPPDDD
jgi:orotate phosphoribosyltransferase